MFLLAVLLLQDGLTVDEFRKLHQDLQPRKDEPWRSVPWKIDLLDVRAQAAKEKKPIFIWSMDGNPLGCG
jgi:hypothetical protein